MLSPILTLFSLGIFLSRSYAQYDSGYWSPVQTTTQYWTPTTASYWSTWTPTSYITSYYTQQNVIITVTSYYPCPVTSTVVYWECCPQCQNDCNNPPTTTVYPGPGPVGTTTVTSYTTTTPDMQTLETVTSNGYVIVMVSSAPAAQTATPSIVYEVSNDASPFIFEGGFVNLWSVGTLLAAVATVMILL